MTQDIRRGPGCGVVDTVLHASPEFAWSPWAVIELFTTAIFPSDPHRIVLAKLYSNCATIVCVIMLGDVIVNYINFAWYKYSLVLR